MTYFMFKRPFDAACNDVKRISGLSPDETYKRACAAVKDEFFIENRIEFDPKIRWRNHPVHTMILSSDGKSVGLVINENSRPCQMEGCTGHRMHVKWDDGSTTFPCSKGVKSINDALVQIG